MLGISSSSELSMSATKIAVGYDRVDDNSSQLVEKLLKNEKLSNVEKSSKVNKSQRP